MAWFEYNQNNSGGSFSDPAHHVLVEADTPAQANARAVDLGLYFDGCANGMDCRCCGDRWSEAWSEDSGYPVPSIYGKPVAEWMEKRDELGRMWGSILIAHADGRQEKLGFEEARF